MTKEQLDVLLWFVALILTIIYVISLTKTLLEKNYSIGNIKFRIAVGIFLCVLFIAEIILTVNQKGIVGNPNFYLFIIWELDIVCDFWFLKLAKQNGGNTTTNGNDSISNTQQNKEKKDLEEENK